MEEQSIITIDDDLELEEQLLEILNVFEEAPSHINLENYNDEEIDVWGYYDLEGDTVIFKDMGGVPCDFEGVYKYTIRNDTLRFQMIKDDECDGRVRGMKGDWIRLNNN